MRRLLRPLVLLIACACAACGPEPQSGDATTGPADTASRMPAAGGAEDTVARPGLSLQALLDRASDRDEAGHLTVLDDLNAPARITVDTIENRHLAGQIDTLRTRHYAGLTMETYHVTGGKELMKQLTVTGEGLETGRGLRVGMRADELERVLGEPEAVGAPGGEAARGELGEVPDRLGAAGQWPDGRYVFQLEGALPTHIHADVAGGLVHRLQWRFPVE